MKKYIIILIIVSLGIFLFIKYSPKTAESPENIEGNNNSRVMGPEEISLSVGETGKFSDLEIIFDEVISDSRCPSDVQCIQAGSVMLKLTLSNDQGVKITLNKSTEGGSWEFDNYRISILEVKPYPTSQVQINKDDYIATLKVESTLSGANL